MIYLDSAATTFQKPAAVQRAVVQAMRTMRSPGRGGYAAAQQADEMVKAAQQKIKELKQVTNDYVDDAMKRTEDAIAQSLSEIRDSRTKFRALVNPQAAKPSPIIEDI